MKTFSQKLTSAAVLGLSSMLLLAAAPAMAQPYAETVLDPMDQDCVNDIEVVSGTVDDTGAQPNEATAVRIYIVQNNGAGAADDRIFNGSTFVVPGGAYAGSPTNATTTFVTTPLFGTSADEVRPFQYEGGPTAEDLTNGTYRIFVQSEVNGVVDTDAPQEESEVFVDVTTPEIVFDDFPVADECVSDLDNIDFSVEDPGPASPCGPATVDVAISFVNNNGVTRFFTGVGNNTSAQPTFRPATNTGGDNFTITGPTGPLVQDEEYTITVRATDAAGNQATQRSITVTADIIAPEAEFVAPFDDEILGLGPANENYVNNLSNITATLTDEGCGGIDTGNTFMFIRYVNENGDTLFYSQNITGGGYSFQPFSLRSFIDSTELDFTANTVAFNQGPAQLQNGENYRIDLFAVDNAGNSDTIAANVKADTVAPVVTIESPNSDQSTQLLLSAEGTAFDPAGPGPDGAQTGLNFVAGFEQEDDSDPIGGRVIVKVERITVTGVRQLWTGNGWITISGRTPAQVLAVSGSPTVNLIANIDEFASGNFQVPGVGLRSAKRAHWSLTDEAGFGSDGRFHQALPSLANGGLRVGDRVRVIVLAIDNANNEDIIRRSPRDQRSPGNSSAPTVFGFFSVSNS